MDSRIRRCLVVLLLLFISCIKTEIINAPEPRGIDTVFVKPTKTYIDTTFINIPDSTDNRVPISFNPTVEDWEEQI